LLISGEKHAEDVGTGPVGLPSWRMTIAKREREENQRTALSLMMSLLGDQAIDTTLFDSDVPPFADAVLRTTWEELAHADCVNRIGEGQYRLTAKGWLAALEVSGAARSGEYLERLGRVLAAMKAHVKGRRDSQLVDLRTLATEANESEGFIFNIIESRASSPGGEGRRGAICFERERGRLVEIPVDFNMEAVDIAAALTLPHLDKLQALEERLERVEEERARHHCPYCDAEISGITGQDFPEHHAYVTYERFGCGLLLADGHEEEPCPYGPNWPQLEEFEFIAKENGNLWVCQPNAKTARARRIRVVLGEVGRTKEEAEENARLSVGPKIKGRSEPKRAWP
jgi:hypothetical protein